MTLKFLIPFCFCFALWSCKDSMQTTNDNVANNQNKSTQLINEGDISKLKYIDFILDEKSNKGIEDWHHYEELSNIISNVKKTDFKDFKDNHKILVSLLKDLKKNIPKPINNHPIHARLLVIETKLFKFEDVVNLSSIKKEELGSVIKELLVAFSNLNFQINKKLEHDSQDIQKPI